MPWWSVLIDAPVQCLTRDSSTLSPDQRGMQLAGAHALSGVSMQVNLSLTSSVCVELDFATLPIMSTCVPLSFFCGAWSWQDQLTSSYLLTTVKSKACLHPLLLAQSKRDTNRQFRGDHLQTSFQVLTRKRATPRLVTQTMSFCLFPRGAYVGVLSSWSLPNVVSLTSSLPWNSVVVIAMPAPSRRKTFFSPPR